LSSHNKDTTPLVEGRRSAWPVRWERASADGGWPLCTDSWAGRIELGDRV